MRCTVGLRVMVGGSFTFKDALLKALKNMRQQNRSLVVLLVCFLEIKEAVYLYAVDINCNPVSNLQQL